VSRVLIVQGDPAVLALMRHALVREGHEVATARSVDEAMDRLVHVRPDLVVSDVELPAARGDVLLGAVGEQYPEMGRLLVTTGPTPTSSFGGITVLRKPWDILHFVETVCTVLAQKSAAQQRVPTASLG
jgi:two-component system, NtrC family, response regulator PilR